MLWSLYPELFSPMLQTDPPGGGGGGGAGGAGGDPPKDADPPKGGEGDPKGGAGEDDGDDGKPDPTKTQVTMTQADLDALVAREKDRAKKAGEKVGRDAAKTELENAAKAEEAKKKGDFETLYIDSQARVVELEGQIKEMQRTALAQSIGARHQLPQAFIDRLKGDTEEEIEADAVEMAKHVGARHAPSTEGGRGAPGSTTNGSRPITSTPPGSQSQPKPAVDHMGRRKVAWGANEV